VVVVTIARYEVSQELTPIVRERYPHLTRFVSVDTDTEKLRFEALGMKAVLSRSVPKGLDLAAAVLKEQGISNQKIHEWRPRQQEQALEIAAAGEVSAEAA